ncbi:MAG: LPS export ABC transporter periplasmic protein LptC [Thermodesulfobacteriota bacterium]|nr:LPS export ABC transporter periplasmic protein LptC [Thermodesulfobacteriota bacterium]
MKTAVLLSVFLLLPGGLYILLNDAKSPPTVSNITGQIRNAPDIVIDAVHQTALKNGEKQWDLTASAAQFREEEDQTVFREVALTAYAKNGPIHATGDRGIMHMTTNDLDLSGNVRLDNDNYKIFTQTLHYQANSLIIYTDDPVSIYGDSLHFTGDAMKFYIKTETAVLSGNVKGILSETTIRE